MLKRFIALSLVLTAPVHAATVTTGFAGGGQAFSNYQPSLVMNYQLVSQGVFPSRGNDSGGGATIGMVRSFGFQFGPDAAQGQLRPIVQNTALFSILGTTYGGNGVNNFALPNLTGRAAIGSGDAPGLGSYQLGGVYGSAGVTLTTAQMPSHDHGLPGGDFTSVVGGSQAFDNMQPSLGLNYLIQAEGVFPSRSGPEGANGATGGDPYFVGGTSYIGEVALFAGNFEPGWMIADGRLLQISQYQALFSIIGTTYGGNGITNFALPDLRGRTIVGAGQGPGLSEVVLGENLGAQSTTLSEAQMPAHDHTLDGGGTTDPAGGSQPFDQHQAGLGMNYLVALQGIFPPRDTPFSQTDTYLGEIIPFAGNFAPRGFALAQGQLLSIAQNTALFSLFGTTYGGDGRTTFALPDLRGRVMLGQGDGFVMGERLGSSVTTLTEANLPSHAHTYTVPDPMPGVPEPGVWALLTVGFGLIGGALRRASVARRIALTA